MHGLFLATICLRYLELPLSIKYGRRSLQGRQEKATQRKKMTPLLVAVNNCSKEQKRHFHFWEVNFGKGKKEVNNYHHMSPSRSKTLSRQCEGVLCLKTPSLQALVGLNFLKILHHSRNSPFPQPHNRFLALICRNHF